MTYWDFYGTLALLALIGLVGVYFLFYVAGSAWKRAGKKKSEELRNLLGNKQGTYYPPEGK